MMSNDARAILQPGRNAWRQVAVPAAGVIVDAADYYYAFYWAARQARRSILMSGWQFDSGVALLRGADAPAGAEVRFLKFLDGLCASNPALHICVLAWDFHMVFAGEREWMQRVYFHWMTNKHFQFRFDDAPVAGGSHHQKFAVVDGRLAFLGGMDVCESRWDDRCHRAVNPVRRSRGRLQKPYHDVQMYMAGGEASAVLEELFFERWRRSGGTTPSLAAALPEGEAHRLRGAIHFGAGRIALSRTDPREDGTAVREVERLFEDGIAAAERLLYIETQYFSSARMYEALVARMRDATRARLQIVIVVNERAEALKEEIAVGLRQVKNIEGLRAVAAQTGHDLGCYYSVCADAGEDTFRATYIHSKLMIVDDRLLTIGSANFTNRSMGVDSELHASWETTDADDRTLRRSIRRVRVSLLAEHSGLAGMSAVRQLARIDGLVHRLNDNAGRPGARLLPHGPPTAMQTAALAIVDPETLPFDPDHSPPSDGACIDEPADEHRHGRWWRRPRAGATAR
jgi:phosphatidylserine/phosphatidylglycerophosphate/cardiolipin synthase-like enzyme